MKFLTIASTAALLLAGAAQAEEWTLDGGASNLAFGSVKNHFIGEVHSFGGLSGTVKDGMADITIDLTSVQTNVDIRNERMGEHVFKGMASAKLAAEIDMDAMNAIGAGNTGTVDVDATLSLLGADVDVSTSMFVARLGEDKVVVSTNNFMFLDTDELGVDAGIDMLQEIAGLDDITRAVPISIRLVFTQTEPAS